MEGIAGVPLLSDSDAALLGLSSNRAESWEVPVRALMWRDKPDAFPEQKVT